MSGQYFEKGNGSYKLKTLITPKLASNFRVGRNLLETVHG